MIKYIKKNLNLYAYNMGFFQKYKKKIFMLMEKTTKRQNLLLNKWYVRPFI